MKILQSSPPEPTSKISKTENEWKNSLTPEQFHILRQSGTERPFGETYKAFTEQVTGTYHCAGCGALLFSSDQKFDSQCGWPSFYDPAKAENITTKRDTSGSMIRIEVNCAVCQGHLGHVFEGEGFDTPTDQRYCINGAGLAFAPVSSEQ